MRANLRRSGRVRQAQSLVEFTVGSVLLLLMVASVVDLGRAYYTWIVVDSMAGEGATYLAHAPDNDCTLNCAAQYDTFQYRARAVAAHSLGTVLSPANVDPLNDVVMTPSLPRNQRCEGTTFSVRVDYHMNDLFFTGITGIRQLTITATSKEFAFLTSDSGCP